MKWSDHNLMWGRPLRAIFALFNGNKITFQFDHLESVDEIVIEQDLVLKSKKVNAFHFYQMKQYQIVVKKEIGKEKLKRSMHTKWRKLDGMMQKSKHV